VDVIGAVGELYRAMGSPDPKEIGPKLWTEGQTRAPEDITLGITVLTAAANFLIDGGWEPEPLSHESWRETFSRLQPSDMDRAVMDRVHRTLGLEIRSFAEAYLSTVLRDYDFEMRRFSPHHPPKPAMVKFFMFRK
jgi:hypothetical protein